VSKLVAISGPAAVGKTTICDRLIKEFGSRIKRLVTATTRAPRTSETDGVDYFFLSKKEFHKKLSDDSFLEHEKIHGNMYGILKESILDAQTEDIDLLFNIDVNGASSLRSFCSENSVLKGQLITIFLKPSSLEQLALRMQERASESAEQMRLRLDNAEEEIRREGEFDYIVESKDKESDYRRVKDLYKELVNS
jgi:guanylate kinase